MAGDIEFIAGDISRDQQKKRKMVTVVNSTDKNIYENIIRSQEVLLNQQAILISKLMCERDEARRNLETASAQWEVWRKQMLDKESSWF
jgi:hypothetical protein